MRLPFIDNDLLYRGAVQGMFDCILMVSSGVRIDIA